MRPGRPGGRTTDEGFTLIEIIVAIGIIGVVMTALLPQLIGGLRSTQTARLVSQAKGVAQGEIDHMRNLPWHVAPDNGTAQHKYYDLFDTYYPNMAAPGGSVGCTAGGAFAVPAETWSGYVNGGTRCSYEPTGPMYRKVLKRTNPGFMVVVDTQFLSGSGDGVPIAPDAGYDTGVAGSDSPYSTRVGVTINVLYADRATNRPVSTYTEIAQQQQSETRLEVDVDSTAVQLSSIDPVDGSVSLSLGTLHLRGALANTSSANATVAAASAGLATGKQGLGASATVTAPGTPNLPDSVRSPLVSGSLGATCEWACWGGSTAAAPGVSSADGLPNAGSAASPAAALIGDMTTNDGFRFDDPPATYRLPALGMSDAAPVVRLDDLAAQVPLGMTTACVPSNGVPKAYVGATGFVSSTAVAASGQQVLGCAMAASGTIQLFPTTFAPYGVVQVQLVSSVVSCSVVGGSAVAPTSSFTAVVRIHDPSKEPASGHSRDAYTKVDLVSTQTSDPLTSHLTDAVGLGHTLADYLTAWSSPTASEVQAAAAAADGQSTLDVPGALTLTTQPTRLGVMVAPDGSRSPSAATDPTSGVALTLGASSCGAKDQR